MKNLSFFEFFVKTGLIVEGDEYGYIFPDYVLVLTQTPEGTELKEIKDAFFRWNVADREEWKKEFEEYGKLARERNRYFLSLFAEKRNSQDYFKRTKVAIRIDIDEPLKLEQVLELVNNRDLIPIPPTHILRSVKGWHIFYITQDFIDNDDRELLYMLHSYTEELKTLLRKYADKIDHTYSIATRYSTEIYELREPYTKEELLQAINDYYGVEIQVNGFRVRRGQYGRVPVSQLSEGVALTLWNACPVLRSLEERWESHTYHEWFLLSWKYAFLYTLTQKEEYKNEFLQKSKLWKGKVVITPEQQFQYTLKWMLKDRETLPYFSCSFVHKHVADAEEKCEKCQYARWVFDENGERKLISNWFKDLFYLETRLEGFKVDERRNLWVKEDTEEPVCELFKIEDVVLYNKPNRKEKYIKIFYRDKYEFIPYVLTASANTDFSEFIVLTFYNQQLFKHLLNKYLTLFQLSRGVREIDKAGYKYNDLKKRWDMVIANVGAFRVEDLNFYMWNDRTSRLNYYIPAVNGSFEAWKNAYRKVVKTKDPIMLILLGHFVSHITKEYFKDKFVASTEPNVLIFLRGFTTTGKTTRLRIASALYGTPQVIQITETTTAKILREFGNIGMPLPLDEFRMRKDKEEEVANMIYAIANEASKDTAYERFNPIQVPVVFSGEKNALSVEVLCKNREGLYRRSIVLDVDELPKQKNTALVEFYTNEILPILKYNHGYIFKLIDFIENKVDIEALTQLYKDVEILRDELDRRRSKVLRGIVKSLDNHLKLIFASIHVFLELLGLSDEEKADVFATLDQFIRNVFAKFYDTLLPKEEDKLSKVIDYLRDLADGLYNASNNPIKKTTIRGLTLKKLLDVAGMQTPTTDIEPYVKLLFMKYYSSNKTYVYLGSIFVEGRNPAWFEGMVAREYERLIYIKQHHPELYRGILEVFAELMLSIHGETGLRRVHSIFTESFKFDDLKDFINNNNNDDTPPDDDLPNGDDDTPPDDDLPPTEQLNYEDEENNEESEEDDVMKNFVGEDGFSTPETLKQYPVNVFKSILRPQPKALVKPALCNSIDEIPAKFNEPIYFDLETDEDRPVLVSIYQPHFDRKVYCLNLLKEKVAKFKDWLLKFSEIRGWGLDYDLRVLGYTYEQLKDKKIVDVQLAIKVQHYERFRQNGSKGEGFRLDDVARDLLGIEYPMNKEKIRMTFKQNMYNTFNEQQLLYASLDAYIPHLLYEQLTSSTLNSLVYQLDQSAQKVVIETSQHGMPVKLKVLQEEIDRLTKLRAQIQREIPFNYNSPKQTAKFFGIDNSSKDVLMDLALKGNEVARKVLEARQVEKSLSFAKDLYDLAKQNNSRIYGNFSTTTAPSGRMSCSDVNLQQIPRRLRQFIGFETEDKKLITADFPQIELRLAGVIWNEPKFIEAFSQGIDLHKLTASILFDKKIDEVSKEERQVGKSANFGLIYGISPRGFAEYCITNGINITEEQAHEIVKKWKKYYTKITEQHQVAYERFKYSEYVDNETWLNRTYRAFKPQDLLNYQIQGSGAELFKKAIVLLKEAEPSLKIVNLVHDEIVVEADSKNAQEVAKFVKEKMEEAWDYCLEKAEEFGNRVAKIRLEVEEPNVSEAWEKG
ncbi:DNA polymerase [Thermocrinis sp.]|jgi:DNA polymerase I-like protein with 3'-5' exonuclease and polymerase domains|uniref:DNA polymerase n=1 Tax=Thermocrinis sp. TaxID=2024383 RepID=UPI003C036E1A